MVLSRSAMLRASPDDEQSCGDKARTPHRATDRERAGEVTTYACGPESMMKAVADLCALRRIDSQLCMERSMACGMGTCQSCVVPVHDTDAPDGWCYKLCCTDGPIFDAQQVIWE